MHPTISYHLAQARIAGLRHHAQRAVLARAARQARPGRAICSGRVKLALTGDAMTLQRRISLVRSGPAPDTCRFARGLPPADQATRRLRCQICLQTTSTHPR